MPQNLSGAKNSSYVRAFPSMTNLSFTPELGLYLEKAELESFNVS